MSPIDAYWTLPAEDLLRALKTTEAGLQTAEASSRLRAFGPNALDETKRAAAFVAFLQQLKNPLVWLLAFAAATSAVLGQWTDAIVVLTILLFSAILSFVQEHRASSAVEKLRARVTVRTRALRDGVPTSIAAADVVPGDVILLSAGDLIPADGVLLDAKDFFVSESVLTGETFPAEKRPGTSPKDAGLSARSSSVFMGTSVRNGTAKALITRTGRSTEFGAVAARLVLRPPETEFERGIRRFGHLLTRLMSLLVLVVFAANVLAHKPPIDSLLFAVALAVGLAPEMLPAVITITLARGAKDMAERGVIVRRLNAIENFGSMDVLCTDKTGTLTEGVVRVHAALDVDGAADPRVLELAYWNASLQTGLSNPIDLAITERALAAPSPPAARRKVDEIPYDFVRKRLSVVVEGDNAARALITKGALERVLDVCSSARRGDGEIPLDDALRAAIRARFTAFGQEGLRVLGVATKAASDGRDRYSRDDEEGLVFEGFLVFFDPPKPRVEAAVKDLARLGVDLKIISGDSREVVVHLARAIGASVSGVLTGAELNAMRDEALWHAATRTAVFAEVDPNQKERIILALRKMGHVVGYMGDGINDAPALHAADVGISVEGAVDVAREAADFVLLRRDLDVLRAGIEEGRATFANTLKYVFTTESANFGNMLSVAGASIVLPFLPLLAPQILLNNFLSDVPAMAIAGDNVDPELVARPRRWDLRFIRRFMLFFGPVSTAFDALTFAALLYIAKATPAEFRTGWFVESLLTELLVALVIRTRRPFWKSRPGSLLAASTAAVAAIALALPYLPIGAYFSFVPLPPGLLALLLVVTILYALTVEAAKRVFFRYWSGEKPRPASAR